MESRSYQAKRYDLSMSRRTRKPAAIPVVKASPDRDGEWMRDANGPCRQSLKDFLKEGTGEEDDVGVATSKGCKAESKAVADQGLVSAVEEKLPLPAIREGKHLQMVKVRGSSADGVKLAGMVTRYVKVLNHLVKARSGSKKKAAVQFLK